MSPHRIAASLLVTLAMSLQMPAATDRQSEAPGEIVARGFQDPVGVAVSADGRIVVSDRAAGTIVEVGPGGRRTVLLRRLDRPAGVAFDEDGGLLVVEQRAGRVLRRDPSGAIGIVAHGLARPKWIAVGADGHLYVSSRRTRVLHLTPTGAVRTFADRLPGLDGIVVSDGKLYAAVRRLRSDRGRSDTEIVRFAVRADGSAGPMQIVLRNTAREPVALAADRRGALVASVREERGRDRGGVIKQSPAGEFATLASTLRSPRGVAFEPAGHLLVVEAEPARQLRRYRAPSPPIAEVPPFTNTSPVALSGRAVPGSLVQVFGLPGSVPLAAATADAGRGAFTVSVPVGFNQETRLAIAATANGGRGLTSATASHVVVHDDHQPSLAVFEPAAGLYTRTGVPLRARADDEGSGVASMAVLWDETPVAAFENPAPAQPLDVTESLSTASLAEGPRALTVTATDRAGNAASTALLVTVDRTAPETRIVSGPTATIAENTATFVVDGVDVHSPLLEFSWRLDEGAWAPFGLASTVALTGLSGGDHRFEVKARDLAGNEDLTPAAQTFSIRSLRIRIAEPAPGAVVTTPTVWVRGTVEGASDVAVAIELPPGSPLAALPASTEAGTFAIELPVEPSMTTVTVAATDLRTNARATESVAISVQPAPDASSFGLVAAPAGGLAPLVVGFRANLGDVAQVSLDRDSDGSADFEGAAIDGPTFVYDRPGVYVATLRATTSDGQVLTFRTSVEVYDRAVLDARLQTVWSGFDAALRAGDVPAVASLIHGGRRAAWQQYYSQLAPQDLSAEADALGAITLVEVGRGGAEYELLREENGQVFSYPVVFVADSDGRWRLWQF
jgi:glucose/arabinose dehydrogenase